MHVEEPDLSLVGIFAVLSVVGLSSWWQAGWALSWWLLPAALLWALSAYGFVLWVGARLRRRSAAPAPPADEVTPATPMHEPPRPDALQEERRIAADELLPRLTEVLDGLRAGAVYRVMEAAEVSFVLGPPSRCGGVLGLVDPEYGWPVDVEIDQVRSVADLRPGPRAHPFVRDGETCVAVAIRPW